MSPANSTPLDPNLIPPSCPADAETLRKLRRFVLDEYVYETVIDFFAKHSDAQSAKLLLAQGSGPVLIDEIGHADSQITGQIVAIDAVRAYVLFFSSEDASSDEIGRQRIDFTDEAMFWAVPAFGAYCNGKVASRGLLDGSYSLYALLRPSERGAGEIACQIVAEPQRAHLLGAPRASDCPQNRWWWNEPRFAPAVPAPNPAPPDDNGAINN